MKNYGKLITGIIIIWLIFALSASALHAFKNDANRVGVEVAIAAVTPIVVFSLWFAVSEKFRQFALSSNPRTLTSLQSWRFIGFTFVLLEARGVLPAIFAWPAGYGDMAIGVTASFVAWKLSMAAMTVLPLSLIPTFLVPLFLMLHVICIAQARSWKVVSARTRQAASPAQQPAI